jgi:hypothetical protein
MTTPNATPISTTLTDMTLAQHGQADTTLDPSHCRQMEGQGDSQPGVGESEGRGEDRRAENANRVGGERNLDLRLAGAKAGDRGGGRQLKSGESESSAAPPNIERKTP